MRGFIPTARRRRVARLVDEDQEGEAEDRDEDAHATGTPRPARRRASSASIRPARSRRATSAASARPPTSAIPRNGSLPSRKAATATSLAALKTAGYVAPASPARRARREQRERLQVGRRELERQPSGEVELGHVRGGAVRIGERVRDRHRHVRVLRDARAPPRHGSGRAGARPTSGWTTTSIRS